MGLTAASVGKKAVQKELDFENSDITALLFGAPNVGKSTVFNALTGLHQHTGNWSGKTVTNSVGFFSFDNKKIALVDLPGTYSLLPHSEEEKVARDSVCFSRFDCVVVVCDATTLEKCLTLVLQILEKTRKVIVCVNLLDQAQKKKIKLDLKKLEKILGVPVIGTNARANKGLTDLQKQITEVSKQTGSENFKINYGEKIENILAKLQKDIGGLDRFSLLRLLCADVEYIKTFEESGKIKSSEISEMKEKVQALLEANNLSVEEVSDIYSQSIAENASKIYKEISAFSKRDDSLDRRLDKIFTGKLSSIPIMLLFLAFVFFLTIYAANVPSQWLSKGLFSLGEIIRDGLVYLKVPWWIEEPLVDGVWRVMAWVVSVMLPPMAIFFPIFTLLEDFGYLPRMAFNLDCCFKKCNACGKQSLCMAMGFGCNAAGVVGCRIIDSPRERLIAILTNSFVPCNGRFPTIIAIISIFFVSSLSSVSKSVVSALILSLIIVFSVAVTLAISFGLSKTFLKGEPSAFTLELPSYRVPKIGSVIVRSIFDRTLFVLGRAVSVSAPMGLLIWIFANVKIADTSIITLLSNYLDPLGKVMGLDGAIILAFILGFPANEIVLPITLMCYLSGTTLTEISNYESIFAVLSANGWTVVTAVCFIVFSLLHFPCSTTLMTIKKETGRWKYTALAFLIPTVLGFGLCTLINLVSLIFA